MNGGLPGLLDDPNLTTLSIPALNDVHIAPLRNPAPSRNNQAPLPLELIDNHHATDDRPKDPIGHDTSSSQAATFDTNGPATDHNGTSHGGRDPIKKPYLAISELVDSPTENELGQVQLPSFVSLSVVEKSPTHKLLDVHDDYPNKRIRLEANRPEGEADRLLLPMPVQKDDRNVRPLLPAMVTGLHEPPPSAAILPSMDPDTRPSIQRTAFTVSKMQVKDMLTEQSSLPRPPEQMLNTPEVSTAELPKSVPDTELPSTEVEAPREKKMRRIRRKWTQEETDDLRAGVKKHGIGKWKQILLDPSYTFIERTSIDLKDRYRVFTRPEEPEASNDDTEADPKAGRQRRKRHPWTKAEDASLLAGVSRHGFQWTDIHNDPTLGLSHRRATDLRDRIRNLYPDGYKHAEARPLRAEVKKAEKAGKKETPTGVFYTPNAQLETLSGDSSPFRKVAARRLTTDGKVPSIAALTTDSESRPAPRRSKTVNEADTGITLPSLALDGSGDTDGWDNTLPPFINWEA